MAEKEKIFSSSVKYEGVFDFKEFYRFCYEWLTERTELEVVENLYSEKIKGDSKDIDVEWEGARKMTDYFKFKAKIKYKVIKLQNVELASGGAKVKTNKGQVKLTAAGTLIRDYEGKFERSAFKKFLRAIYEKWVIPSRIEQMEDKIAGDLNGFLEQAKAYLALEGRQ